MVIAAIAELPAGHGYNAETGEYGDLMAQGVIDPVKVTRSAVPERRVDRRHAADDRGAGHARSRSPRPPRPTVTVTATSTKQRGTRC